MPSRTTGPDAPLARLIAPVAPETFFAERWERCHLRVARGDPTYFTDLLTLDDVDRLLATLVFQHADLRMVDTADPVARADYMMGDRVDPGRLLAHYQRGATVVFEQLDGKWPPLAALVAGMERLLRHPCQTNVYMTPGRMGGVRPGETAQGLRRHHDTHDVFVLQVHGAKRWHIYDRVAELPLKSMSSDPDALAAATPVESFVLEAGDTLYLPRGVVHDAQATDSASLHITLGVIAYTWLTLVAEALGLAAERDVALRRALPPTLLRGEGGTEALDAMAAHLARSWTDGTVLKEALDQVRGHFMTHRRAALPGQLVLLERLDAIGPETVLRMRPDALFQVQVDEGAVRLLYHRAEIEFPGFVEPALSRITEGAPFTPAALPGDLDEAGRLVLARRLAREGFVVPA